jgi:choline dehydrogenase-like flavoprotein
MPQKCWKLQDKNVKPMITIVILEWPIHEMGTARMGDPKTSVPE